MIITGLISINSVEKARRSIMMFETNPKLAKMTRQQRIANFPTFKRDWLDEDSWYKGARVKVNVKISTAHDIENEIFYFHIYCQSQHHDKILDDTHILKNRPAFKSIEEESDYYDYLRTILGITLSEIKLLVDNIDVVGPSGIINVKRATDQNEVEKYYWAHPERYYRTKGKSFLRMINKLIHMDEIIEKARKDSENVVFNVPFFDDSRLIPSRFGFMPYYCEKRKRKHGSFVFDYKKLHGRYKKKTTLYVPDKYTKKIYALDTTRRTFMYKEMLDYYIEHGEEATLNEFSFDKVLDILDYDEELESGYRIAVTYKKNKNGDGILKNTITNTPDKFKEHLTKTADINVIEKASSIHSQYYIRKKDEKGNWVRDTDYDKTREYSRPLWQPTTRDEHFGPKSIYGARYTRPDLKQVIPTFMINPKEPVKTKEETSPKAIETPKVISKVTKPKKTRCRSSIVEYEITKDILISARLKESNHDSFKMIKRNHTFNVQTIDKSTYLTKYPS